MSFNAAQGATVVEDETTESTADTEKRKGGWVDWRLVHVRSVATGVNKLLTCVLGYFIVFGMDMIAHRLALLVSPNIAGWELYA